MGQGTENLITQIHNGPGDNVGSKYVFNGPSPASLENPIAQILESARHRLFDEARTQLGVLSKTTSIDNDTRSLFEVLDIYLLTLKGGVPQFNKDALIEMAKTFRLPFYSDIANSMLMRLDCAQDGFDIAEKRFNQLRQRGKFSREVYFELIADGDVLCKELQDNIHNLGDAELCGIFRGGIRLNDLNIQLKVAIYLTNNFNSFNSQVFLLMADVSHLFEKIKGVQYWYTAATDRKRVLSLCERAALLIDQSKGCDFRLLRVANQLLEFTIWDASKLQNVCFKYISKINEVNSELGAALAKISNPDISQFSESDFQYKLLRARGDVSYRIKICEDAIADSETSYENALIIRNYGALSDIERFFKQSEMLPGSDGLEQTYIRVFLEVASAIKGKTSFGICDSLNGFISRFKSQIGQIDVGSIEWLCQRLLELNRSPAVCKILEGLIPTDDLWMSPLTQLYLYALMRSLQFMTLNNLLQNFSDENKGVGYWKLLSHHFEIQSQYGYAIEAIRAAIDCEPGDPSLRMCLINLLELNKVENVVIAHELGNIPEAAFREITEEGFYLISKMLEHNLELGDEVLIDWFLKDPVVCSKPITNIFFQHVLQRSAENGYKFKSNTRQCDRAVTYSSDGERKTVLVTSCDVNGQNFVGVNSPLGKLLFNAELNCDYPLQFRDIRVHEVLPPALAAFRISLEIRENIQDGTDTFLKFTLQEDNPESMLSTLEQKLFRMESCDRLFANPQIPICMKGHRYRPASPMAAALSQLAQKKSVKPICPSFGEGSPTKIILDIYSIVHIFLSGLDVGLLRVGVTLIVSKETEKILHSWLADINRPDYMTIGVHPDGGLWRSTAADIQRETNQLQEFLRLLLEKCEVTELKLVDLPPDLTVLEDVVDESTLSSIRLAIANDIHWCCIDSLFINLTSKFGYQSVNVNEFYRRINNGMTILERKQGFFNSVAYELPVQLTFQDLIQMAQSQDQGLRWVLPELMRMNVKGMQAPDGLAHLLAKIVSAAIVTFNDRTLIRDGIPALNPAHKGDVERIFNACCYTAITAEDPQTAEARLAPLLKELLTLFNDIPNIRNLIAVLAERFILGHFLCREELKRLWVNA